MKDEKFKRKVWNATLGELRRGSVKYVEAILPILENLEKESVEEIAKNMTMIGYAMGVLAGRLSDSGIEGFTLILSGIKASVDGENRKEKMLYAIWDKYGDLHSSEEGYRMRKGDQP